MKALAANTFAVTAGLAIGMLSTFLAVGWMLSDESFVNATVVTQSPSSLHVLLGPHAVPLGAGTCVTPASGEHESRARRTCGRSGWP